MFQHIVPHGVLIWFAERVVEPPDMFGPPVIAFPAIRVAYLLGPPAPALMFAQHIEQVMAPEMQRLQIAALTMPIGLNQHRFHRAVFVVNLLKLADNDVEGLVPAYRGETVGAASGGIGIVRVPTVTQQRIFDAGIGMHPLFGGKRQRHLYFFAGAGILTTLGGFYLIEANVIGNVKR